MRGEGVQAVRVGLREVFRGRSYRWVEAWAVVCNGRAWQPWMSRGEAVRLARLVRSEKA